jgi:hypothetical protein
MTWKKKCITAEENKNMNDIVFNKISEVENDESTNVDDTVAAKDVNIVPQMTWQECIVEDTMKVADDHLIRWLIWCLYCLLNFMRPRLNLQEPA